MLPSCSPLHDPDLVSPTGGRKVPQLKAARKLGRPRKHNDIRELVVRLARQNVGWGHTRIQDLRGLKLEIGCSTVAKILAEAGIEPAAERIRKRPWK